MKFTAITIGLSMAMYAASGLQISAQVPTAGPPASQSNLPAITAPEEDSATELAEAYAELEATHARNYQVLQGVLDQVPPSARPGIEQAMSASQRGWQRAQDAKQRAVARRQGRSGGHGGKPESAGKGKGGKPDSVGQEGRGRGGRPEFGSQGGRGKGGRPEFGSQGGRGKGGRPEFAGQGGRGKGGRPEFSGNRGQGGTYGENDFQDLRQDRFGQGQSKGRGKSRR